MQKCESDFLQLFYFWKNEIKLQNNHFLTFAYVYDVFWCSEGSKRSKSLKWRRWSSFRSKMTQAALCHTCPTFFDVSGVPKRVLGAQNAFRRHFCTSAPQNHQETSDTYDKSAGSPNPANFLLRSAPWEHLGHIGSRWGRGWLAGC